VEVTTIGLLGVGFLILLLAMGVPIAFAMAAVGLGGIWILEGPSAAMAHVTLVSWSEGQSFVLVTIPLFVLMGQLVFYTGLASDLYSTVHKWIGRVPGGIAITSVLACGGFGAVTGSSIATVATMGSVVMPEMRRYNYDVSLATGSLAASGTLGILIPPSLIFIFYGVMTESSIGALFMAGVVPGILVAVMFSLIILLRCLLRPELGPRGPSVGWSVRFRSLTGLVPVLTLFVLVIGGIYAGLFTPTEAAGVGCAGVLILAGALRRLTRTSLSNALERTALVSAMIFSIIIGGYVLARFIALTGLTEILVDQIVGFELTRVPFLLLLVLLYLILGAFLDAFGMLVLTIPFIVPVLEKVGVDLIWFGVFAVMMTELALVTPPIGANVFVMRRVAPDVPMGDIFRGVLPFVIGVLAVLGLLTAFPELVLWLPSRMG